MTYPTINISDKKILTTNKPFNFYLLIIVLIGLCILLITVIYIRQLDLEETIITSCIFFLVALTLYANFGQYLATIRLYGHKLEVNYLFPWNKSIVFWFDKLIELDYKDIPFYNGRQRWYVGAKWLYLKNERGEICQFKYNINNSDDKELLEKLRAKK